MHQVLVRIPDAPDSVHAWLVEPLPTGIALDDPGSLGLSWSCDWNINVGRNADNHGTISVNRG